MCGEEDSGMCGEEDSGMCGEEDSGMCGEEDSGMCGEEDSGMCGEEEDNRRGAVLSCGLFVMRRKLWRKTIGEERLMFCPVVYLS